MHVIEFLTLFLHEMEFQYILLQGTMYMHLIILLLLHKIPYAC